NNIPLDKCAEKGIVVFNTPGANSNAVAELVLGAMIFSSRNVLPATTWAKTLKGNGDQVGKMVEKGKSQFVGPEIKGKTLGVIGLGAIGGLVANDAAALGMNVIGYDPFLSVDVALRLSRKVKHVTDLKAIFEQSDIITIHVPLIPDTKNMINAESIASMKDGVRILNFARGGLVNNADIKAALASGKVASYVIDFPDDEVLDVDGIIAIPHLGASTPESEDNCAMMAVDEIKNYLENGSIVHSVNYPDIDAGPVAAKRVCVLHKNIPNVLTKLSAIVSNEGVNIENMLSKSKGDYAYSILDFAGDITDAAKEAFNAVDGVIRVRFIG
ncbi:MAG: phosphoglycerate dehydrogenase, partial [Clostridia bacterium]|nr:phosphoglycerate dehydrogenase [Clostridia bacterium]